MELEIKLWSACSNLLSHVGYIDKSGLVPRQIYDDRYIRLEAPIQQSYNTEANETEFRIDKIFVDIKQKSENLPVVENGNPIFGIERQNGVEGLQSALFETTRVATIRYHAKNFVILIYYRPGRWINYVLELGQDLEDSVKKYRKLDKQPVDDSSLFPDKYKLDNE